MANPPSLPHRLQHQVARSLVAGLPASLQLLLAGRKSIERDGLTLHPELQLVLALRALLRAPPLTLGSPEQARRRYREETLAHAGEPFEVGAVRDLALDTSPHPMRARHYAPGGTRARQPLLVFLHGGGFVLGDLDTHDQLCRLLCRHAEVHVLSVEYRLAPEHPFPAAVDDAVAAFRWARQHAAALGADAGAVAVAGDSAGGNLAAAVAMLLRDAGEPRAAAQLLLYPTLDRTVVRRSLDLFADGFFLTRADIDWFQRHYLAGSTAPLHDARISPLRAPALHGLAPAVVVTAGFDPLRDEGEAYAAALKKAGSNAVLRRFDGLTHGFANMVGVSPACERAVAESGKLLREAIERGRGESLLNGSQA